MENKYRALNKQKFDKLAELVENHPRSYFKLLKAMYAKPYKRSLEDLYQWIKEMTSNRLNENVHGISTMVFWILNGIEDFPRCQMCGKQIGYFNKIQVNGQYPRFCHKCARNVCGQKTSKVFAQKNKEDLNYYKNIDAKRKATNLVIHGNPNYNNMEKNIATCIERYGVENVRKTDECKTKIKATKKLRYGNENYVNVEKIQETCLKHYGCNFPQQNPQIRSKARSKYSFDGYKFDSKFELCLYIWLKDNKIEFEFKPNIVFSYNYNDKQHFYMPDFKIEDQYVEIKGDHFFKEDGTMQNPFDHSQNGLYEAKHQCMLTNNVKILRQQECGCYLSYVKEKYGNDFFKMHRS